MLKLNQFPQNKTRLHRNGRMQLQAAQVLALRGPDSMRLINNLKYQTQELMKGKNVND